VARLHAASSQKPLDSDCYFARLDINNCRALKRRFRLDPKPAAEFEVFDGNGRNKAQIPDFGAPYFRRLAKTYEFSAGHLFKRRAFSKKVGVAALISRVIVAD